MLVLRRHPGVRRGLAIGSEYDAADRAVTRFDRERDACELLAGRELERDRLARFLAMRAVGPRELALRIADRDLVLAGVEPDDLERAVGIRRRAAEIEVAENHHVARIALLRVDVDTADGRAARVDHTSRDRRARLEHHDQALLVDL